MIDFRPADTVQLAKGAFADASLFAVDRNVIAVRPVAMFVGQIATVLWDIGVDAFKDVSVLSVLVKRVEVVVETGADETRNVVALETTLGSAQDAFLVRHLRWNDLRNVKTRSSPQW